jgi:hypothetical protein
MQPEMAFVIDFRKPIDGQIEALRHYAEGHQQWLIGQGVIRKPETRNVRQNEWLIYLRLLDAELDSVTDWRKLAAAIPEYKGQHAGPNNDSDSLRRRINDNQSEARLLRDGGYLWIAAITTKRRSNSRSKNGSTE